MLLFKSSVKLVSPKIEMYSFPFECLTIEYDSLKTTIHKACK